MIQQGFPYLLKTRLICGLTSSCYVFGVFWPREKIPLHSLTLLSLQILPAGGKVASGAKRACSRGTTWRKSEQRGQLTRGRIRDHSSPCHQLLWQRTTPEARRELAPGGNLPRTLPLKSLPQRERTWGNGQDRLPPCL